jgi:short-subunit dehydrogenase
MPNIVITGGSTGFGRSLTYEFCKRNNNVLIAGRSKLRLIDTHKYIVSETPGQCLYKECDVQSKEDLQSLASYAQDVFNGEIDHWINNAGVCEGPENFDNITLENIEEVIMTNALGVIIGTKVAKNIKVKNVYTISGHGSDFMKTPKFAIYGASKAMTSHFYSTLLEETRTTGNKDTNFHVIAPGIMKTILSQKLLESDDLNMFSKMLFERIAVDPAYVATKVVPKILSVSGTGKTIRPIF